MGLIDSLVALLQEMRMKTKLNLVKSAESTWQETWLETVRGQVTSLPFGVVQIVVHDSKVVQIERTEN